MALILNKHLSGINLLIALFLLFGLIAYSPEAMEFQEENQLLSIIVPYVQFPSSYRTIITSMFVFLCLFSVLGYQKYNIWNDRLLIFMDCRLLFGVIQIAILSLSNTSIKYGNYYLYLLELLFYIACLKHFSNKDYTETFLSIIKIFVFLVSVEVIIQCFLVVLPQVPYISLWYKSNMRIPIGSSNTLSAMILPVAVAEMLRKDRKNWIEIIYLMLMVVAIFLTKSRFAMIILLIVFCKTYIIQRKNALAILSGIVILLVLLYLIIRYSADIMIVIAGFSDEVSGGGTLNKLSSGRVADTKSYFDVVLQNPIIGFGPNYEKSRAHNILVDVLYQNGIIGLLLFISAVTYLIKRYNLLKRTSFLTSQLNYVKVIFLTFLVQSLGEISYFTDFHCDVMFIPCVAILAVSLKKRDSNLNLQNRHARKLSES